MPRKSPYRIVLSPVESAALASIARRYTLPYYLVLRAKMILLAAEGWTNDEIASRLSTQRDVVSRWRQRFFHERLGALKDRPRSGRPRRGT